MEFYAYHLMLWLGPLDHLFCERDLFHQFLVDMYAKIESERLAYIVSHQKELRVDDYAQIRDSINNDASHGHELGKMVILSSTFTVRPRYMQEKLQDALTYVKRYGLPDLFITFTCNPKWAEITAELLPGQASCNLHDIIARVFRQKVVKLIDLFTKYNIFGLTRCNMYSIEWEKRGLPHAHILLWLQQKLHPAPIDSFISAELPSQQEDPKLHDIIKSHMAHGPCSRFNPNSPCMKDGKCTKNYPKQALKETQTGRDGYPLYKRCKPEDGESTAKINFRLCGQYQEVEIDNRWIFPYCSLLSRVFNVHINVEFFCNSVMSIKYVCKYINKGSDMAVFNLKETDRDEVRQYQTGRYISSNEAVWRILGFPIHERHPAIEHLAVHVENGQRVYFTARNAAQMAQEPPKDTTLTAFFKLCHEDEFAFAISFTGRYHATVRVNTIDTFPVYLYYFWKVFLFLLCNKKPAPDFSQTAEKQSQTLFHSLHIRLENFSIVK